MNKLDKIVDLFSKIVMGVSALVLSVVTILQVIARFIFSNPIPWGQDVIRLSFVYLVFFGGAYCVFKNEHLNIDIVFNILNEKNKKILASIIDILLIIFFIFLVYYGFIFTKTGLNQKAPYLDIPMAIYYLSLPIAALTMVYFQIRKLWKDFLGGEE
ncbi:TRAP transporter small permease [Fusobacterium nucleatum]|uniref:C4-dicarboxylate ABC transporter permease n=1 Tax=Fusobacterium nucleatum subsp. polymorphum TaxID=76857 RepID=A0A2C6A1Y3_FUSNP|nr:TRAP transporter small permease [Fusobacterium polymorphum]PHH96018.1 C4-dicarboxylate ABC transporter permease [Fusobacterium polymorphum]